MLFLMSWTGRPECRDAAMERFLTTRAAPPDGIRLIGRWHAVGMLAGFALVEASDPAPIMQWISHWSDLLSVAVHPAISDPQLQRLALHGSLLETMAPAGDPIEVSQSFLAERLRAAALESVSF